MKVVFIIFFIFTGCTTINYKSKGVIPTYLTGERAHFVSFKLEGKAEFYLWGFYPKKISVYIDELAQTRGYVSISKLNIQEYLSWDDYLFTIISLGMYAPRTFEVSGYAQK